MAGEFAYIDWLRKRTPSHPRVLIGPGDDCAALAPGSRPLLVTTDMLMDGTDFLLAEVEPRRIGCKAMAVNLSDIAAMAGVPIAAVVSVALPQTANARRLAEELYLGMREMADRFQVPIVGGDTNSWDGKLVISVTLFGEATERGPVRRNGAKPGDLLFVTGPLGGSILGRHLDFTPRITEALALHQAVDIHAMIDISDGLSADLHHILDESHCGATLYADAIPIHPDAIVRSQSSGRSPLEHALTDGEDFELIFAVPPEQIARIPSHCYQIGECTPTGYVIVEGTTRRALQPSGWVHPLPD